MTAKKPRYEVLVGMDWVPPGKRKERRVEPGDVVQESDFAEGMIPSLIERGRIRPVDGGDDG